MPFYRSPISLDWALTLCKSSSLDHQDSDDLAAAIEGTVSAFGGPSQLADAKTMDFSKRFSDFMNGLSGSSCQTEEDCQTLKRKLWAGAASMLYSGMKSDGASDSSASARAAKFLDSVRWIID